MHSISYDRVSRIFIGGGQDIGFQEQLTPGQPGAGVPGWDKTSNGDGGDAAIDFITMPGQGIRYGSSQNLGGFFRRTMSANNVQTAFVQPATTLVGGGTAIVKGGGGNMPFMTPLGLNAVSGGRLAARGARRFRDFPRRVAHYLRAESFRPDDLHDRERADR